MKMVKANPYRELLGFERDFGELLDRSWSLLPAFTDFSAVDMYEQDGKLVTEVALPNFKRNEVKVTATSEGLEISADHKEENKAEVKNRRYLLNESSQSYWRRLSLPPEADVENVKCVLKDGKLTITMPLIERKAAKSILIE